jgi:hypothetical protein
MRVFETYEEIHLGTSQFSGLSRSLSVTLLALALVILGCDLSGTSTGGTTTGGGATATPSAPLHTLARVALDSSGIGRVWVSINGGVAH